MNRRVHIFNRVFWPAEDATAQLAHDLAMGLAARGWDTSVITSTPGPESSNAAVGGGAPAAVRIVRTGHDARRNTGLLAKANGYLRYLLAARRAIAQEVRSGDRVIVMTDPPLLSSWLRRPLARAGARVFQWTQDIYPEVAIAIRPFGPISRLLDVLKSTRDSAWRDSERIVTLGEDMAALVRSRGIAPERTTVVPNWAPHGLTEDPASEVRAEWGAATDDLVISYSGNLGRAHDLAPLLDLAARLLVAPKARLVVIGHGPQKPALEREARRRGLTNLSFFPPVARDRLSASLSAADLHLVTMREACLGTVWPSKFYGIVACGRPLIFVGPAEADIARLVRQHSLGLAVSSRDIAPAERLVRQLLGDPARRLEMRDHIRDYAQIEFASDKSIAAWHSLLGAASSNAPALR